MKNSRFIPQSVSNAFCGHLFENASEALDEAKDIMSYLTTMLQGLENSGQDWQSEIDLITCFLLKCNCILDR
ncbi:MAG: hypothetical protein LBQ54_04750 [Planctomycetaceae bacterium]|jgi:hypothetical protein|nr:hypothetical protein [Planctomycetaceae bacterium]